MLIGIAIICFLYGPMLCALKDVPPKTEQEKQENSVRVFYQHFKMHNISIPLIEFVNLLMITNQPNDVIYITATDGRWLQQNGCKVRQL